jgi:23S rRNA-/tRNA-specific pseudouridylate synthase
MDFDYVNGASAKSTPGLQLLFQCSVREPFHELFAKAEQFVKGNDSVAATDRVNDTADETATPCSWQPRPRVAAWAASRRSRKKRGAAGDWLSSYGYCHVRTTGKNAYADRNVDRDGACHYVFAAAWRDTSIGCSTADNVESLHKAVTMESNRSCWLCGWSVPISAKAAKPGCREASDSLALISTMPEHWLQPAIPPQSEGCRAEEVPTSNTPRSQASEPTTCLCIHEKHSKRRDRLSLVGTATQQGADLDVFVVMPSNASSNVLVATVGTKNSGSRLRAYLRRQCAYPENALGNRAFPSKSQAESWIQNGQVIIDGKIVTDSGQLLHSGEVIAVCLGLAGVREERAAGTSPDFRMVDEWSLPFIKVESTDDSDQSIAVVVWKGVGVRTTGVFDQRTLESRVRQQLQLTSLVSVSKLDTGCSGLCVLGPKRFWHLSSCTTLVALKSTFTALVHGSIPVDSEHTERIECEKISWKRKEKPKASTRRYRDAYDTVEGKDSLTIDEISQQLAVDIVFRCLESATLSTPQAKVRDCHASCTNTLSSDENFLPTSLSTVEVTLDARTPNPAAAIAYWLRHDLGTPVVGDRFSGREYSLLPRPMRNRLKRQLCIGCTGVALSALSPTIHLENQTATHTIPEKWKSSYWYEFEKSAS